MTITIVVQTVFTWYLYSCMIWQFYSLLIHYFHYVLRFFLACLQLRCTEAKNSHTMISNTFFSPFYVERTRSSSRYHEQTNSHFLVLLHCLSGISSAKPASIQSIRVLTTESFVLIRKCTIYWSMHQAVLQSHLLIFIYFIMISKRPPT